MKYIALLVLSVSLLFTGCTTTGGNGSPKIITPTRIKTVAYLGSSIALQQHPEWRLGFQQAATSLKAIESQDKIDFAVVLAIVNSLPVKELKGKNATIYITAATLLFDDLGGTLDLSKTEKVRPYITGLREGIELAIQ